MPTTSWPSTSASSVLNTRSGSTPSASAASSPKFVVAGSWVYCRAVKATPAAVSATVAGVPGALVIDLVGRAGIDLMPGVDIAVTRHITGRRHHLLPVRDEQQH